MKNQTMKNDIFNLDQKSILAKLLSTENITVQHNNVPTASFDVKNRILTLPIFKVKSKDVHDMLTGHECAHALWTDPKEWEKIADDDRLRQACNVLEDCRIDKMIQAKYPGLVKNYINGFDILNNADFFGIKEHDVNELSIIDKINMFYKSSKRLDINFTDEEKPWLPKVDKLKTFDDVVKLAKSILDYQDKKDEENNLDGHLDIQCSSDDEPEKQEEENNSGEPNNEKTDEENGTENSGDNETDKKDEGEEGNNGNNGEEKSDNSDETSGGESKTPNAFGAGGDGVIDKPVSVTNKHYEDAIKKLTNTTRESGTRYVNLPELTDLNNTVVDYKLFLQDYRDFMKVETKDIPKESVKYKIKRSGQWTDYLERTYKKFKKDNMKTVMYLVKEFEMKKSATAYKRASTDKTGILDPLKLKNYKFSDDIFKRMTILPNGKNHGMIVLVDWSGSMYDIVPPVISQLSSLAWFCEKVNIPFEIYLFNSEKRNSADKKTWNFKENDMSADPFMLLNIASSRMKKTELDEALKIMKWISIYYENRNNYDYANEDPALHNIPYPSGKMSYMGMGSTPLNEALIAMTKIIPQFKKKYDIEKLSFITLTDGYSNTSCSRTMKYQEGKEKRTLESTYEESGITVLKGKKKTYTTNKTSYWSDKNTTSLLLEYIKTELDTTNIGFYLLKSKGRREFERQYSYSWIKKYGYEKQDRDFKEFKKSNVAIIQQSGYDEYYLTNGAQNTQSHKMDDLSEDAKPGEIKRLFAGSMKNRLSSRVLLNKFIEKIA